MKGGAVGEHPVRPGVIEWRNRLRAVGRDDGRELVVNDIQRVVSGQRLETPFPLGADPPKRPGQSIGAVREVRIDLRDLGAQLSS